MKANKKSYASQIRAGRSSHKTQLGSVMCSSDYSKEATKLIEFTQKCVANNPTDNDAALRMRIEMKNRREFRRNIKAQHALNTGRYDLLDLPTLSQTLANYPELEAIYHKADPEGTKIENIPVNSSSKLDVFHRSRSSNFREHVSSVQKQKCHTNKRQKMVETAQQNTDLIKTLLGNQTDYIDLTHSPPSMPLQPPPAPVDGSVLSSVITPSQSNMSYQYQTEIHQTYCNSQYHANYPSFAPPLNSTMQLQAYGASNLPQSYQTQYYSGSAPIPVAHMTSTLPPPNAYSGKFPHERKGPKHAQSNISGSKMPTKGKAPKSLKKMGNLVKKYDLDT